MSMMEKVVKSKKKIDVHSGGRSRRVGDLLGDHVQTKEKLFRTILQADVKGTSNELEVGKTNASISDTVHDVLELRSESEKEGDSLRLEQQKLGSLRSQKRLIRFESKENKRRRRLCEQNREELGNQILATQNTIDSVCTSQKTLFQTIVSSEEGESLSNQKKNHNTQDEVDALCRFQKRILQSTSEVKQKIDWDTRKDVKERLQTLQEDPDELLNQDQLPNQDKLFLVTSDNTRLQEENKKLREQVRYNEARRKEAEDQFKASLEDVAALQSQKTLLQVTLSDQRKLSCVTNEENKILHDQKASCEARKERTEGELQALQEKFATLRSQKKHFQATSNQDRRFRDQKTHCEGGREEVDKRNQALQEELNVLRSEKKLFQVTDEENRRLRAQKEFCAAGREELVRLRLQRTTFEILAEKISGLIEELTGVNILQLVQETFTSGFTELFHFKKILVAITTGASILQKQKQGFEAMKEEITQLKDQRKMTEDMEDSDALLNEKGYQEEDLKENVESLQNENQDRCSVVPPQMIQFQSLHTEINNLRAKNALLQNTSEVLISELKKKAERVEELQKEQDLRTDDKKKMKRMENEKKKMMRELELTKLRFLELEEKIIDKKKMDKKKMENNKKMKRELELAKLRNLELEEKIIDEKKMDKKKMENNKKMKRELELAKLRNLELEEKIIDEKKMDKKKMENNKKMKRELELAKLRIQELEEKIIEEKVERNKTCVPTTRGRWRTTRRR